MSYRQDIHVDDLVVWAYQVERADMARDRGAGLHALEAAADGVVVQAVDCTVRAERAGLLGARIGGGGPCATVHPDAEAVAEAVARLGPTARGLVDWYGKTALVPDWQPDGVRYAPRRDRRGRPIVEYADSAKRRPLFCVVDHNAEAVAFARKVYGHWWQGLVNVAEMLDDLTSYRVLSPKAQPRPWERA